MIILPSYKSLLLGRRRNPEEYDLYGMPGGKGEAFETTAACMRREVKEETGLTVLSEIFLGYVDEFIHNHYLAMMFVTWDFKGEVQNLEPTKCGGWEWHPLHQLPPKEQRTVLLNMCIDNGILDRAIKQFEKVYAKHSV
jgi:8-oxo-dGTP pyrophosphatase MutT (NUDIX family)